MAEFKRVMGILKRKYESMGMYDFDYDEMEQEALQWEAEHPEPVYPTWGEWFTRIGLYHDTSSANINANDLIGLLFTPIRADIAEKLGIEPKDGGR